MPAANFSTRFVSPGYAPGDMCVMCGVLDLVNRDVTEAADGTRTHDLVLTKDVLYQLSYSSG